MDDPKFFQAVATAIPTLFIALGFTSGVLNPDVRVGVDGDHMRRPRMFVMACVCLALVVSAEMVALITLATGNETAVAFILCITAVGVQLSSLAAMAVYRLSSPTFFEGVEVLLFPFVAAASGLIALLLLAT